VVAEVALAVMLVAGAGLLMRSFWNLLKVDAGFDRSRLTTFELVLPDASYPGAQRKVDVFDRAMQRIRAIPGVASVTAMSGLPPMRRVDANDTDFEGVPRTPDGPAFNVDYYQFCTTSYFDTMKIPIVSGRAFTASDATGPAVAIVNEALAKRFYPNDDPIGHRIRVGGPKAPWLTIVGVAKDVKQGGVSARAGTELYVLQEQSARLLDYASNDMNIVVRATLPYDTLAPQLRSAVGQIDASLPIVRMRTMDDVFQDSVERPRFLALLLGVFALLALTLAAVGTYGILSYIVTERRHEIGVRMALGADRRNVLEMVLGQGLLLAGTGIIAGLLGSFVLNRALASLLFNITPSDPSTLAIVAAIIAAVALAACVVPAESATRTDPLTVLRE
jgi:predicted permease